MEQQSFGPHLTLDLKGCEKEKLLDLNFLSKFLRELPEKIGMTAISPPYVFYYSGKIPEDHGVTGFQVLAESHISLHSFVDRDGYLFLDIFSCLPFDTESTVQIICDTFKPKSYTVNIVERGLDFDRSEKLSSTYWTKI